MTWNLLDFSYNLIGISKVKNNGAMVMFTRFESHENEAFSGLPK